jgi:hypothetical protein
VPHAAEQGAHRCPGLSSQVAPLVQVSSTVTRTGIAKVSTAHPATHRAMFSLVGSPSDSTAHGQV